MGERKERWKGGAVMDITVFLGVGIAAELILSLVRLKYTRRGLICWTLAAVVLLMCCVVYFAQAGELNVDIRAVLRCAAGVAVIIGAALLVELISPSRRRRKAKTDLPEAPGERSLNLVLSISAGILCGAAFLLMLTGDCVNGIILIIFPAAAALRQTSYFMRRSRYDTAQEQTPESRRTRLTERISGEKYKL